MSFIFISWQISKALSAKKPHWNRTKSSISW
uniref:Uncharacterized protein n=1 Tax=Siphoviridae sp. ctneY2 TaxID=2825664 RepID=A0A8S5V787_9CAUD|nr:MAG TPA: hypothetical protein [Siphoviridae sp. ctneY2]